MRKKIEIGIGRLDESARRFAATWHDIQRRKPVKRRELLTFDDLDTLLRVLTPTRWTLLRILRGKGPMSVRLLAKALARDYKNVHSDVRELERVSLVSRAEDGRVTVPWDTVVAEVRLDAA